MLKNLKNFATRLAPSAGAASSMALGSMRGEDWTRTRYDVAVSRLSGSQS